MELEIKKVPRPAFQHNRVPIIRSFTLPTYGHVVAPLHSSVVDTNENNCAIVFEADDDFGMVCTLDLRQSWFANDAVSSVMDGADHGLL
jgi:hypothetical protein